MIHVGILGVAGYTGQELLGLLLDHPEATVAAVTSNTFKDKPLAEVFPRFAKKRPLVIEAHDPLAVAGRCDAVFLCLPHRESMSAVPGLVAAGAVVFDLSADFRLRDAAVYEKWYGVEHTAKELIGRAVYGLPELYKGQLRDAGLVAVPGCYPTSAILGLAPVIDADWIDTGSIVINAASGVTGAGRKAAEPYMFAELQENFYAYAAPNHRHTPEIEQELGALAGAPLRLTFIPHLAPAARGIYSTITVRMTAPRPREAVLGLYAAFYRDSRFVTVSGAYPQMKWTTGANGCFIGVEVDERTDTLIITSTLDNLVKGASGQAVQCFNIRYGFDEALGLE